MFSNVSRRLMITTINSSKSNFLACNNIFRRVFFSTNNEIKSTTSEISYLDIRVGRIINVTDHPTEEHLYVQQINVGDHLYTDKESQSDHENAPIKTRSIIAGIKEFCTIDELLNTDVVVVCNLKPRNIKGVPSDGMVLCCSNIDKSEVKPIRPPSGSSPGSPITFAGHSSLAFPPGANKLSFNRINKAYKAVCSDFIVNENGFATWKNVKGDSDADNAIEFETDLGPIKGEFVNGNIS